MLGCESIVCRAQAFLRQPGRDVVEKKMPRARAMPDTGQTMAEPAFAASDLLRLCRLIEPHDGDLIPHAVVARFH
jgi:hypothetical protein